MSDRGDRDDLPPPGDEFGHLDEPDRDEEEQGPLNEDALPEPATWAARRSSEPDEEDERLEEEPLDEEPLDEEPLDEEPLDEEPLDEEPLDEEPLDEEPLDEEAPAWLTEEPLDEEEPVAAEEQPPGEGEPDPVAEEPELSEEPEPMAPQAEEPERETKVIRPGAATPVEAPAAQEAGPEPEAERPQPAAEPAPQPTPEPPPSPFGDEDSPARGGDPPGMILPPGYHEMHVPDEDKAPGHTGLWVRFLAASAVIVAAMATATAVSLLLYLSDIAEGLRPEGDELKGVLPELAHVDAGDPQNIMIIGSDRRYGEKKLGIPARSDTVILMRLNPDRKAISLLSLPRDLKVNIPGHGVDRFNTAYSEGGPKLTLKVVKQLTGLKIHHLVNVNFQGFKRAVNAIDCVYVDVDQRYFNSNVGKSPDQFYAEINLKPGYQRLCGQNALDYARYRHTDNDLVRAARQQNFLREARQKIGPARLINEREKLLNIFTRYTSSDIDDAPTVLEIFKLFLASREAPVKQVHFRGEVGPSYVTASDRQIQKAVNQFLNYQATKGPAGKSPQKRKKKKKRRKAGVFDASEAGKQQARLAQAKLRFPVYYPRLLDNGSTYVDEPRVYNIRVGKRKYRSYKMVISTYDREFYGVMGTPWRDPPILKNPSTRRRIGKREYLLFYDGDRVRLIGWKTSRGSYWISNTLLQSLTAKEMLAIAKSVRPAIP